METVSIRKLLIQAIDDAFEGPNWFGPALLPSLSSLTVEQALFISPYEGYSAWKVMLHCAYWTHVVLADLDPGAGSFLRIPADWPDLPEEPTDVAFREDLGLLVETHRLFRQAVLGMSDEQLSGVHPVKETPVFRLVGSIPAHDTYHTAHIRNLGIAGLAEG
ncbi:MAG TPA: DinB family protein [Spirochaetia bacterium]|nr:DinB family protein [Spirochaetia bacterium]